MRGDVNLRVGGRVKTSVKSPGHRSDRFNRGGANIGGGIGFFSTSPFICVFVLFCVFVFMFCVFVFLFCVFVKDRTTPREGLDFSFMRCSILI